MYEDMPRPFLSAPHCLINETLLFHWGWRMQEIPPQWRWKKPFIYSLLSHVISPYVIVEHFLWKAQRFQTHSRLALSAWTRRESFPTDAARRWLLAMMCWTSSTCGRGVSSLCGSGWFLLTDPLTQNPAVASQLSTGMRLKTGPTAAAHGLQ